MSMTHPDGYLALPASGTGPAVLVLHAWWGLNDTIRTVCTRLAEAGFVAYAPDLYHGPVTDQIAEAETLSSAVFDNLDQARASVAEGASFLLERAEQTNLAVIGFSLGAFFALDLSVADPAQVRSVVVFYGTRPGDYREARAAYLGHFAETDVHEPQAEVDALEAALRAAGRPVTFYHYPRTGHWFFEPDRTAAYDPAAAELAWTRTLAFLRESTV